jgi:hypothetical protein
MSDVGGTNKFCGRNLSGLQVLQTPVLQISVFFSGGKMDWKKWHRIFVYPLHKRLGGKVPKFDALLKAKTFLLQLLR